MIKQSNMARNIGNRIEAQRQLIAIAEITATAFIASVIDCINSGTSILPIKTYLHEISEFH